MKRAWGAAAAAALIALAIGFGVADGSGSSARPGVAYVTGTSTSVPQVWLANSIGRAARRLGPGEQPLLSPNGSMVAASSPPGTSGSALLLYSAGSGQPRKFFNLAQATALAQTFSPDSRYLAVVLASTDPDSDAASGLAIVDTRTMKYKVLARGPIYGASFAADGSDRVLYASATSMALSAAVDIHVLGADGSGAKQLTRDGRSLNPVWAKGGTIAFDHERLRAHGAPEFQVWTMGSDGSAPRALTSLRVPVLLNGLVPLEFSPSGDQLLAEYEGEDTSQAWEVSLSTSRAHELRVGGQSVSAGALSRSGSEVLVDVGGFLNAPDQGVVEQLPLGGGPARILVPHGSQPSWNL